MTAFTHVAVEIDSQPKCWRRAAILASTAMTRLPLPGERVAVVGCGTSWFVAQSYAALRERCGQGFTDAFPASEFPGTRDYDRIVAITRSGTTSEVLDLLSTMRGKVPTVAITADSTTPVAAIADELILLDFADEVSMLQTRFATSALALFRASLGEDLDAAIADAQTALAAPLRPEWVTAEQFTFLGCGWTLGLANESALKLREAAGAWTESYSAIDYRHGPISVTAPGRLVWVFGQPPAGLADAVAATGGAFVTGPLDPLAELVTVQRLAVRIAHEHGRNPDRPRHLAHSVLLERG